MKVLVVGEGGREHALCWAIARSPICGELYCAPGNAGIAELATCLPIAADDLEQLISFAVERAIDLVVVGPERPLVLGLVDRLNVAGIKAFGPTAEAARLESSKIFTKQLCRDHGIPTARYQIFSQPQAALEFVDRQTMPVVIKIDGLAAGKGVTVARSTKQARQAITSALIKREFGPAGNRILIEEFLHGQEVSFFVLVDGQNVLPLASACDYKPAFDGNQGPNTGGMGAYSPAPMWTEELQTSAIERIIEPTIKALGSQRYQGVLYAGLMVTRGADGKAASHLLEYNVRFGDPECQVLMLRLESDLLTALLSTCRGILPRLQWRPESTLAVVMATTGYPEAHPRGTEIKSLPQLSAPDGMIFQGSTSRAADGSLRTCGGRSLAVTTRATTLAQARALAYQTLSQIDWPEGFYRTDIGL